MPRGTARPDYRTRRLVSGACLAALVCIGAAPALAGSSGRSILAFQGKALDGWKFDFTTENARRRLVVYLFDPTGRGAAASIQAAQRLHAERHAHNLTLVGVMMPQGYWSMAKGRAPLRRLSATALDDYARKHLAAAKATFPCIVDTDGRITALYLRAARSPRMDWRSSLYVFAVAASGGTGKAMFSSDASQSAEPAGHIHRSVLRQYGIEPPSDTEPLAGDHPKAPDVKFVDTQGNVQRLADYRGKLVILVFIMRKCPKCKAQLAFLETMLRRYGRAAGGTGKTLEVLAVAVDAAGRELRSFVATRGYTFPVGGDRNWAVRGAFRYRGGTPDTFVIAPDGTVRYRHRSYTPELQGVMHMEIRKLLGLDTQPIFGSSRYNGTHACRICHEKEYLAWTHTRHACAWETLVRLGKEDDGQCVKCHVVAYLKPGGFITPKSTPHLTDVQCESCHGRNGCAAFTGKKAQPVQATACAPCHDAKHSPRFDFATARPKVLHDRMAKLASLPRAEREQRLKKLCAGADRQLFNPDTPYIGSEACGKCHPTEFQALNGGFHTTTIQRLIKP
ncbi:redoxin domain-containing protein, partial [bacterium]|nr:redoxin domain-containing protein [bacterium]